MTESLSRADRLALVGVILACAVAFLTAMWWGTPIE